MHIVSIICAVKVNVAYVAIVTYDIRKFYINWQLSPTLWFIKGLANSGEKNIFKGTMCLPRKIPAMYVVTTNYS